jgi:hypothetical protein
LYINIQDIEVIDMSELIGVDSKGNKKWKTEDGRTIYKNPQGKFISPNRYGKSNTKITATVKLDYDSPRGDNHNLFVEGEFTRVISGEATEDQIENAIRNLIAEMNIEFDGMMNDTIVSRQIKTGYETEDTDMSTGNYGGEIRYKWKKRAEWKKREVR